MDPLKWSQSTAIQRPVLGMALVEEAEAFHIRRLTTGKLGELGFFYLLYIYIYKCVWVCVS